MQTFMEALQYNQFSIFSPPIEEEQLNGIQSLGRLLAAATMGIFERREETRRSSLWVEVLDNMQDDEWTTIIVMVKDQ